MNPCPILERFSPYASTKALAEQAVLAAHHPNGMRTIALRPHLIWGEGDPHLLPRVISRHRLGKLKIVGERRKPSRHNPLGQCGSCPSLCFSLDGCQG